MTEAMLDGGQYRSPRGYDLPTVRKFARRLNVVLRHHGWPEAGWAVLGNYDPARPSTRVAVGVDPGMPTTLLSARYYCRIVHPDGDRVIRVEVGDPPLLVRYPARHVANNLLRAVIRALS